MNTIDFKTAKDMETVKNLLSYISESDVVDTMGIQTKLNLTTKPLNVAEHYDNVASSMNIRVSLLDHILTVFEGHAVYLSDSYIGWFLVDPREDFTLVGWSNYYFEHIIKAYKNYCKTNNIDARVKVIAPEDAVKFIYHGFYIDTTTVGYPQVIIMTTEDRDEWSQAALEKIYNPD